MTTRGLPNIALTGQLRSGKSAAADYLRDKYGYTQFAFGDELKRYAHELFDVPRGPDKPKPRALYQWFGQTMRTRDPEVWVRKCFEYIEHRRGVMDAYYDAPWNAHALQTFRAVITDVRQLNEFERCRAEGYAIIRITAPLELRIARAKEAGDNFDTAALNHETERHVGNFAVDYEIDNSGSLADLHAQIDAVMAQLTDVAA